MNIQKKRRFKKMPKIMLLSAFKMQHQWFAQFIKSLFKPEKPQSQMNYQDLAKIGVDPAKLMLITRRLKIIYRGASTLALIIALYLVYLLVLGSYWSAMLAFSVCSLCLAQAFKHHFWCYQIKQQRLGCSITEWLGDFLGKK